MKLASAFSLLELAIVMAILSLMIAGGLSLTTDLAERSARNETNEKLDVIDKAIRNYVKFYDQLPCPADLDLTQYSSTAGYASSVTEADCEGGTTLIITGNVTIGGVPVRDLGLQDHYEYDGYGNRFRYAMTHEYGFDTQISSLANPDIDGSGSIIVEDADGNIIANDAAYFLISFGKNAKGAISNGLDSASSACSLGTLDIENCDSDLRFREAPFNNGDTSKYFDDFVRWGHIMHLRGL